MKKLAIILDSFSGKTEKFFKENYENVFFLPLQIFINGKQILEGKDKDPVIEEIIDKNNDIKTSLPVSTSIEEVANKVLDEYENVVCLFINSNLSSTYSVFTAKLENLKKEKGKKTNILAFDNHFVSEQYLVVVDYLLNLSETLPKEKNLMKEITNYLEEQNKNCLGFIIPSELSSFARNGRLIGIKKFLSSRFFLLIKIFNGVKISGISRTFNGAVKKVINKLNDYIKEIKGPSFSIDNFNLTIVYAWDEKILKEVEKIFKSLNIKVDFIKKACASTTIHTGYGAVFIGISPKKII
ncbi:MAG: DegV family protein [Metamycoplasmataceae bacterium]